MKYTTQHAAQVPSALSIHGDKLELFIDYYFFWYGFENCYLSS